eukprot:14810-Pelagococcus_subviridis.AAC.1
MPSTLDDDGRRRDLRPRRRRHRATVFISPRGSKKIKSRTERIDVDVPERRERLRGARELGAHGLLRAHDGARGDRENGGAGDSSHRV